MAERSCVESLQCAISTLMLAAARTGRSPNVDKLSPEEVARLRGILSTAVNGCEALLIIFNATLNALSPVRDLPGDVLSRIMVTAARSSYYGESYYGARLGPVEWIALAQVCRRWRTVALATPSFWAYIRQPSQRVFRELVNRSQTAPLYVTLSCTGHCSDVCATLDYIANTLERVHELQLNGVCLEDMSYFQEKILDSRLASRLGRLALEVEMKSLFTEAVAVVRHPLDNLTNLRHLEFRNVIIPWRDHVFSSPLTTLILGPVYERAMRHGFEIPGIGSYAQFQRVMETLAPTLEVLELSCCIPHPRGEQQRSSDVSRGCFIWYPRLRRLKVTAHTDACAHFFERVVLPASECSIRLYLRGYIGFEGIASNLFEYFATSVHPLSSLRVKSSTASKMLLIGWTRRGRSNEEPQVTQRRVDEIVCLNIEMEDSCHDGSDVTLHRPFHSILVHGTNFLQSVQSLDINMYDGGFNWSALFARVPELESLCVGISSSFIHALLIHSGQWTVQDDDEPGPNQPPSNSHLLPHLRRIYIREIHYREGPERMMAQEGAYAHAYDGQDMSTSRTYFWTALREILKKRDEAGIRLEELSIEGHRRYCPALESVLPELSDFVDSVTCNWLPSWL